MPEHTAGEALLELIDAMRRGDGLHDRSAAAGRRRPRRACASCSPASAAARARPGARSAHRGHCLRMPELDLTRTHGDRRLYAIDGVGTLRLDGLWSRSATAEAGQSSWRLARKGVFKTTVEASDAAGFVVGTFTPKAIRRGGELRWGDRDLTLRPASAWRERYALAAGDRELAVLDGKGWGRRPVKLLADDPAAVDPGLLLFAAFVVRGLAEDAASSSSGAAGGS